MQRLPVQLSCLRSSLASADRATWFANGSRKTRPAESPTTNSCTSEMSLPSLQSSSKRRPSRRANCKPIDTSAFLGCSSPQRASHFYNQFGQDLSTIPKLGPAKSKTPRIAAGAYKPPRFFPAHKLAASKERPFGSGPSLITLVCEVSFSPPAPAPFASRALFPRYTLRQRRSSHSVRIERGSGHVRWRLRGGVMRATSRDLRRRFRISAHRAHLQAHLAVWPVVVSMNWSSFLWLGAVGRGAS